LKITLSIQLRDFIESLKYKTLIGCFWNILELESNLELSKVSHKAISYAKEIFVKNIGFLKKGFTPETDNTMEQIFSLIGDVIDKARLFKTDSDLTNFCYNLFHLYSVKKFFAMEPNLIESMMGLRNTVSQLGSSAKRSGFNYYILVIIFFN
jgi:hypothetical protein